MVTFAMPPPSHIVCKPYRFPRARSACTSVAVSLAPEAPSGCPSPTFASSAWFGGDAEAEYGVDIEFRLIL
jgi:hypothetical protein